MEESEQRKERLRAMRLEASQAQVSHGHEASAPAGGFSNPLIEPFSAPQDQEDFQAAPRFDFYTNPMAAFSGNKRRSSGLENPSGFSGPRNVEMTPHLHQMQNTVFWPQDPYGRGRPFAPDVANMHQGPRGAWSEPGNPVFNLRPGGMESPGSMNRGPPPGAWSRPYPPGGGGSPCPGFVSASSPNFHHGQGRFHGYGSNRFPGPGSRGSPDPFAGGGRGGRRGVGFYGRGSAYDKQMRPGCYFHESMLEDPWKDLEPALWMKQESTMSSSASPGSSRKWRPDPIGMKKERASEGPGQSSSGPSLAEHLAASFNEAADEKASE